MCFNDYIKYIYKPHIHIQHRYIHIYIDYILYEFKPLNITKSQNVQEERVIISAYYGFLSDFPRQFLSWLCDPRDDAWYLPSPSPSSLPTTLPVLTFAFSFLMWIGSEISTTSIGCGPCVPETFPPRRSREACEIRVCQYLYYMRGCLINNFYKECACSWRPPAEKNGLEFVLCRLGCATLDWARARVLCACDSSIAVRWAAHPGKTFAIKAVAESGQSACKVCRAVGWARGFFFFSDFSTVACRRGVTQAVCLFALLIAYPCPLPPAHCPCLLPNQANYQHLVYLPYTPGRRHNELSRLSAASYTPAASIDKPKLVKHADSFRLAWLLIKRTWKLVFNRFYNHTRSQLQITHHTPHTYTCHTHTRTQSQTQRAQGAAPYNCHGATPDRGTAPTIERTLYTYNIYIYVCEGIIWTLN